MNEYWQVFCEPDEDYHIPAFDPICDTNLTPASGWWNMRDDFMDWSRSHDYWNTESVGRMILMTAFEVAGKGDYIVDEAGPVWTSSGFPSRPLVGYWWHPYGGW